MGIGFKLLGIFLRVECQIEAMLVDDIEGELKGVHAEIGDERIGLPQRFFAHLAFLEKIGDQLLVDSFGGRQRVEEMKITLPKGYLVLFLWHVSSLPLSNGFL